MPFPRAPPRYRLTHHAVTLTEKTYIAAEGGTGAGPAIERVGAACLACQFQWFLALIIVVEERNG